MFWIVLCHKLCTIVLYIIECCFLVFAMKLLSLINSYLVDFSSENTCFLFVVNYNYIFYFLGGTLLLPLLQLPIIFPKYFFGNLFSNFQNCQYANQRFRIILENLQLETLYSCKEFTCLQIQMFYNSVRSVSLTINYLAVRLLHINDFLLGNSWVNAINVRSVKD